MSMRILSILMSICFLSFIPVLGEINMVGMRVSSYGITPSLTGEEIRHFSNNFKAKVNPAARSAVIWNVGAIQGSTCHLEFPNNGATGHSTANISFSATDQHAEMMQYFTDNDIDVYLQVEAGMANPEALIDLVLKQYGYNYSCVKGIGFDVEWYKSNGTMNTTAAITDALSETLLGQVQWYGSADQWAIGRPLKLFFKHWISDLMPKNYRGAGDIIYINDSQGYLSMGDLITDFTLWAQEFAGYPVAYQIGYNKDITENGVTKNDYTWWSQLANPAAEITKALATNLTGNYDVGVFWVDFTSRLPEVAKYLEEPKAEDGFAFPKNCGAGTSLQVDGEVKCDAVIIGDWKIRTPDYVFESDYDLRSLKDVEKFINENSHLPEVPSASDMKEDGVNIAELNMVLLKKIEELTLYTIALQKQVEEQAHAIKKFSK